MLNKWFNIECQHAQNRFHVQNRNFSKHKTSQNKSNITATSKAYKKSYIQYSQRGTFINPLTAVVKIFHARSNTAAEHPLTVVVMTLEFRDDRTRGFAVVAREGSSRSTVFFVVYIVTVNCIKIKIFLFDNT